MKVQEAYFYHKRGLMRNKEYTLPAGPNVEDTQSDHLS